MPLQIEHVDPSTLVPAPYNPRSMTDEAFERLKRGIAHFGLVDPIIARRHDALVVGGHQRLRAALEMGHAEVPVVFLDDLDDEHAAALNVLLNNPGAQGEWDFARLSELLSTVGLEPALFGFNQREYDHLLALTGPPPPPPDDILDPLVGATITGYREQGEVVTVRVLNLQAEVDVRRALSEVLALHPEWDASVEA